MGHISPSPENPKTQLFFFKNPSNQRNPFLIPAHQVKDMDQVLDMGCGIGGPLRGVVRATGANVTGLTINQHQVSCVLSHTKVLVVVFRVFAAFGMCWTELSAVFLITPGSEGGV